MDWRGFDSVARFCVCVGFYPELTSLSEDLLPDSVVELVPEPIDFD